MGSEGEVWLRDGKTATPIRQIHDYGGRRAQRAEFFSEGNQLRLVTTSDDRTVRIWDPVQGTMLSTINSLGKAVLSISLSPGAKRLLVLSRGHGLRLWDLMAEMPVALIPDATEEMTTAAYRPSDGHSLVGSKDGRVKVYVDDYPSNLAGTLSDACSLLRHQGEFEQVLSECRPAQ